MDNTGSEPTLAQLRARQTELVAALAVETGTARLAELSTELETVATRLQGHGQQAPQEPGVQQREDGVVIEPGSALEAELDKDQRAP
ncbi:hypothetical protein J2M53_16125 [Arthrobacter sp. zg-ZUI100]|uniref:hypothetical protein n=1 Tax=Arthrobacter jiangjiafuii TaxID=2817475 RepID=UPI001AEE1D64|nr:hypothetical protein [Arthrobacter jiangjiafuii]MBP3037767.1 hypothetical protein [Arthrobacter jiangjiafuii]